MMQTLTKAFHQKNYIVCIKLATQTLQKDALNIDAWFICAMSLYYLGDVGRCIEYLEVAYSLDPKNENVVINLAELYRRQGFYQKAIEMYLGCVPSQNSNIYYNLGLCYAKSGDTKCARKAYEKALSLDSDDKDAMYNLANIYAEEKNYKIALKLYEKCQTIDAISNLTCIYNLIGKEKRGLRLLDKMDTSFKFISDNAKKADFYFNYANMARYGLFFSKARELYLKALHLHNQPAYAINYAYLLLSLGEFKEGFRFYQQRLTLPKIDKNNAHFFRQGRHIGIIPNDKDIKAILKRSKVLLFYEQGFGDSLMFGRFIDRLECKHKYIYVQRELQALFGLKYDVVEKDFNDYDYCISLPSLPYMIGVDSLEMFRNNKQWLLPHFKAHKPKTSDKSPKLRVGFFFHSNPNFTYAKEKSIPLERILLVLADFDYELTCLQPEGLESFLSKPKCALLKPFLKSIKTPKIRDFLDTTLIMEKLDLIISVDSAIAHLAIAMGKPCLILAHKRYDWRWGKLGQTEFEGMAGGIIFAQKELNDWDYPLELLKKYLLEMQESNALPQIPNLLDSV